MTHYELYQFKHGDEGREFAFRDYDSAMKRLNMFALLTAYEKTYEGSREDAKSLEDFFTMFNIQRPDDFKGHSMSVGDMVLIIDSDRIDKGLYYCDSFGFKKVAD